MGLLTLAWKDWIEIAFRINPDHHGGLAEWAIVGISLTISVSSAALARHEWRRPYRQRALALGESAL
jgi:hypothetical protein